MWPTIKWEDEKVIMIDQRKLPVEEVYVECLEYEEVAQSIERMIIRGAPAIGVAAAYGIVLGVQHIKNRASLDEDFNKIYSRLERARPTARNLFWALERMGEVFQNNKNKELSFLQQALLEEAQNIENEDLENNKRIGQWGRELIKDGDSILTHCNAGALATAGYGTALGVIRAAHEEGKALRVYADETRPFLQGARLTCWELDKDHISVVLIADNMAGFLMQKGDISLVITGADRIALNGDTANKIGTYTTAVLSREHGLPFYVAAPLSTVDFHIDNGSLITIEERDPQELREIDGRLICPPHIEVRNPAFDVTPAPYISAIITEAGIARPPYEQSLKQLRNKITENR